jgi:hypothetical protein
LDDKNVLRKLLREVVNNAVARGHLPDDDLLDELASMGPAPSADFRQRLERQLVDELRAQEKKGGTIKWQLCLLMKDAGGSP